MPQLFELASHMIDGFPQNGPSDPIEYYRKPLIGRLYLDRINRGLRLLPNRRYARALRSATEQAPFRLHWRPGSTSFMASISTRSPASSLAFWRVAAALRRWCAAAC